MTTTANHRDGCDSESQQGAIPREGYGLGGGEGNAILDRCRLNTYAATLRTYVKVTKTQATETQARCLSGLMIKRFV